MEGRGEEARGWKTRLQSCRCPIMESTMSVRVEDKTEQIAIVIVMDMHAMPMAVDNALLDQSIQPMDLASQPMDHMPTLWMPQHCPFIVLPQIWPLICCPPTPGTMKATKRGDGMMLHAEIQRQQWIFLLYTSGPPLKIRQNSLLFLLVPPKLF